MAVTHLRHIPYLVVSTRSKVMIGTVILILPIFLSCYLTSNLQQPPSRMVVVVDAFQSSFSSSSYPSPVIRRRNDCNSLAFNNIPSHSIRYNNNYYVTSMKGYESNNNNNILSYQRRKKEGRQLCQIIQKHHMFISSSGVGGSPFTVTRTLERMRLSSSSSSSSASSFEESSGTINVTQMIIPPSLFILENNDTMKGFTVTATTNTITNSPDTAVSNLDLIKISKKQMHSSGWTIPTMKLALPAVIAMLSDPILSCIDTMYVGRLGGIELGALGVCTSIFHLSFSIFRGTTAATTSLIASALATAKTEAETTKTTTTTVSTQNNLEERSASVVQQITALSLWLGSGLGIIVMLTLFFGGDSILASMGVSRAMKSPLYQPAADYLYTRCWAGPVALLLGVCEGVFRGYGNTLVPLFASCVATIVNTILDPILMFHPQIKWGVKGAAAATAIAQIGALFVYVFQLIQQRMIPPFRFGSLRKHFFPSKNKWKGDSITSSSSSAAAPVVTLDRWVIIRRILLANVTLLVKQGSLLLGWTYATSHATKLGSAVIATHQVGVSFWLLFAFIQDGLGVAAQVLMSQYYYNSKGSGTDTDDSSPTKTDTRTTTESSTLRVYSLVRYMIGVALIQGLVSMLLILGLHHIQIIPKLFVPANEIQIRSLLTALMPHLAYQQILVSCTLVLESLAIGMNQFQILASGTTLSTILCIYFISIQSTLIGIWSIGIVSLFTGRLLTALVGCGIGLRKLHKPNNSNINKESAIKVLA